MKNKIEIIQIQAETLLSKNKKKSVTQAEIKLHMIDCRYCKLEKDFL